MTDYGYSLPAVSGCRWERREFGYELWRSQNGKRMPGGYVCRVGKRKLLAWAQGTPQAEIGAEVLALVTAKQAEKGIA